MGEPSRATMLDGEHYQELASKLRGIARQSRSPGAREKILKLASLYDVRANHLDTQNSAASSAKDPG